MSIEKNLQSKFWYIDSLEIFKSFNPSTYWKNITKLNEGYHSMFVAVESVSRYLYIININKTDKNEKIIKWIRTFKPKYIFSDMGIINNEIRDELRKIDCISTVIKAHQNDNGMFNQSGKSESVYLLSYKHPLAKIDRLCRTIRQIIAYLLKQNIMNDSWIDNVKLIQDIYNNHKHSSLYDWVYDSRPKGREASNPQTGLNKEKHKMIKKYYTPSEVAGDEKIYNIIRFNQQLKKIEYNKKVDSFKVGDFVRYKIPLPVGYKKTNALSVDIYKITGRYNNLFYIRNINNPDDIKEDVSIGELKKISLFKPESTSFEGPTSKLLK